MDLLIIFMNLHFSEPVYREKKNLFKPVNIYSSVNAFIG